MTPSKLWTAAIVPSGEEFSLEIAADPVSRARGYMFRETVGSREGMLFVFDSPEFHSFWMKNCRVRLDIVWLDERSRVVDIAHDLGPCPEGGPCPSILPMGPAQYVIEFAGGTAKRLGLKRGDRIILTPEPPRP